MFFRKKTTMSLYITHGSPMVMKGVANAHSKNEPHFIAICALIAGKETYKIKSIKDLKERLSNTKHPQKEAAVAFIENHQHDLTQEEFLNCVNTIKKYFKISHVNLRADGNLFHNNSDNVSTELCYLVDRIRPQSLVLFSETPACIADSQKYLNRESTNKGHFLPSYRLSGNVAERKTLNDVITHEKEQPTIIPVPNLCCSFFISKIKQCPRSDKVFASNDTQDISLRSNRTIRNSLLSDSPQEIPVCAIDNTTSETLTLQARLAFYNNEATTSDDFVRAFHPDEKI